VIILAIQQKKINMVLLLGFLLFLHTAILASDLDSEFVPVSLDSGDDPARDVSVASPLLEARRQGGDNQRGELDEFNRSIARGHRLRRKQYCCCAFSTVMTISGVAWYVVHKALEQKHSHEGRE
jgi:hypothetical protein